MRNDKSNAKNFSLFSLERVRESQFLQVTLNFELELMNISFRHYKYMCIILLFLISLQVFQLKVNIITHTKHAKKNHARHFDIFRKRSNVIQEESE